MAKFSVGPAVVDRRRFLIGSGALALAATGWGTRAGFAASGELTVGNWGGDWNDRTVKFIEAPYVEAKGIKILRDLANVPERKAKLVAERRLPRGTLDIAHLSDADAYELNEQDVLEKLDEKQIPNLATTLPTLRLPYFVPWLYSGMVLLYNPTKIAEPPTSFAALWDPKYAGKVGINDQNPVQFMQVGALLGANNVNDFEAAKARMLEMKKAVQPRLYPTHQQLAAGFKNEEIWIAANWKARGLQFADDGVPVRIAVPKEGAIAITYGASIPKRARNKEAAYFYLNEMLEPGGLAGLAQASSYAPSVTNVQLPPEVKARVDFTPAERENLKFVDFAYFAKNTPAWFDWWTSSFKA